MASHQLREAVSYTKFNCNPYTEEGNEPTKSAIDKQRIVQRAIKGMSPKPFGDEKSFSGFVYDCCDAALNGVSMSELMWEQRMENGERLWMPRASAWIHPRHLTFTPEGYVSISDDNSGRLYPDTRLVARDRVVEGPPNEDKFICSQFISRSGSSLGAGFMRPLAWYWAARQFNLEWMLNTAKQFGSPFIEMTFNPAVPGQELHDLENFLKNAGPERRLLHPTGTVATIHPAENIPEGNPQRYLMEEADKACLFLLLGQSGTTMQTPGKLGQEGTHADVKDERVMGLANWVARNPLRQFARAVIRVNYGEDSECPNIEPDFTKPLDAAQVSQLASAISSSRTPVRADEFYRKLGFTQPEKGDLIIEGGRVVEMSAVPTQDELGQIQMALQQAQQGEVPGQEDDEVEVEEAQATAPRGADLRDVLRAATDDQLDELEGMVLKAADSGNGEWKNVKVQISKLSNNRIKFD